MGLFSTAQAQLKFDKRFVYQVSYSLDSTNAGNSKNEFMELLVNDSISLFQSVNIGILDSINQELFRKGNTFGDISSAMIYRTNFTYYILKENNNLAYYLYSADFNEGLISYNESITNQNWIIDNKIDTIMGLICQSASLNYGGRIWTAWFSIDIPISNGPYKFGNLPGLIVKLKDKTDTWDFTLYSIEPNISKNILFNEFPKRNIVHMDKEKLNKSLKYFEENKISIQESTGKLSFPTAEDRKIITDNYNNHLKKRNNTIEL